MWINKQTYVKLKNLMMFWKQLYKYCIDYTVDYTVITVDLIIAAMPIE